ncbi:hypothetical protein HZS_6167, partial [Henneguya salminicola]
MVLNIYNNLKGKPISPSKHATPEISSSVVLTSSSQNQEREEKKNLNLKKSSDQHVSDIQPTHNIDFESRESISTDLSGSIKNQNETNSSKIQVKLSYSEGPSVYRAMGSNTISARSYDDDDDETISSPTDEDEENHHDEDHHEEDHYEKDHHQRHQKSHDDMNSFLQSLKHNFHSQHQFLNHLLSVSLSNRNEISKMQDLFANLTSKLHEPQSSQNRFQVQQPYLSGNSMGPDMGIGGYHNSLFIFLHSILPSLPPFYQQYILHSLMQTNVQNPLSNFMPHPWGFNPHSLNSFGVSNPLMLPNLNGNNLLNNFHF